MNSKNCEYGLWTINPFKVHLVLKVYPTAKRTQDSEPALSEEEQEAASAQTVEFLAQIV